MGDLAWYSYSLKGFLNYSRANDLMGLMYRLDVFSTSSTPCRNALFTRDIPVGYGPGFFLEQFALQSIEEYELDYFDDEVFDAHEEKMQMLMYFSAINPAIPFWVIRQSYSNCGWSSHEEFKKYFAEKEFKYNPYGLVFLSDVINTVFFPKTHQIIKEIKNRDISFNHYIDSVRDPKSANWHEFYKENMVELVRDIWQSGDITLDEISKKIETLVAWLEGFSWSEFYVLGDEINVDELMQKYDILYRKKLEIEDKKLKKGVFDFDLAFEDSYSEEHLRSNPWLLEEQVQELEEWIEQNKTFDV